MHRILSSDKPAFIRSKVSYDHPYQTRHATGGNIRYDRATVVEGSFISRATRDYNSIPDDLKAVKTLPTFKYKLRRWTLANIPIQ